MIIKTTNQNRGKYLHVRARHDIRLMSNEVIPDGTRGKVVTSRPAHLDNGRKAYLVKFVGFGGPRHVYKDQLTIIGRAD